MEEDPRSLRVRSMVFDLGLPMFVWLSRFAFWERIHAPTDNKVEGTDDPSPDSGPNYGEAVYCGLGCNHPK